METSFTSLFIAVNELMRLIDDYKTNFGGNDANFEKILSLNMNNVGIGFSYQNECNLMDWEWQMANTIAPTKFHIDTAIKDLIKDLENKLLTIHNSNGGSVVLNFVNRYFKAVYRQSYNYSYNEIELDFNEYGYLASGRNFCFSRESNIVMKYTTRKLFFAIHNIVNEYSIRIPDELNETLNLVMFNIEQEPQTPTNPILPPKLSTPEAMKYWKKAQEAGLVDEHYQWLETKVLLACFAKEMSDRFDLGKGTNSDGSKRINWKIFENLFGVSNLRGALNDLKKTGDNPLNINLVNDIFK